MNFTKTYHLTLILVAALLAMLHSPTKGDHFTTEHKSTVVEDLSDREITNAITREFIIQDGVNANNIDIETKTGIVTLEGEVNSLLAKDRAAKVARMVKGVRGVVNLLEIESIEIGDNELMEDINGALLMDAATEAYEIDVSVNNGKVVLSGKVESWQEKDLAEKVVKGINGVREIENDIHYEIAETRADSEIEKEIEATFNWDIRIDETLIDVNVKDNNVTLSGSAGSAAEKNLAFNKAWVAGVRTVNIENLEVRSIFKDEDIEKQHFTNRSDTDIKRAIDDAFMYDPRVYSFNPRVEVDNGVVTLSGTVDNLKAKKAAEMDAHNIEGVWKVENHLKVRPNHIYRDRKVAEDIRKMIYRDPVLEPFKISVSVKDGKAYLSGSVDNFNEKYHAAELASTVNGVTEVSNRIEVESSSMPYAFDYDYYHYSPYWKGKNYEGSARTSDLKIKSSIQEHMFWSSYVNKTDIQIEVNNGIVELSGEVDSWNEKYFAEKNAYEGGAVFVENNIDVNK